MSIVRDENFVEYCDRPSYYLTDKYIINKLFASGIPREITLNNPDLIEFERMRLKIIRLIKQKKTK